MKTLLVVDDEKFIRQGIIAIIKRHDKFETILEARNGREAFDIVQNNDVDIMITDIRMPDTDGIELIKKLKDYPNKPKTIVLSGYDEFNYAKEALNYNARAYLLKPVDRNELMDTIASLEKEIIEEQKKEILITKYINELDDNKENLLGNAINNKAIDKVITYINENFYKDLNLAIVSNYVSLNYSYFSLTFKEKTGLSFTEYLKLVRINKSKELLKSTNKKIYEIAKLVGYENPKQFMKVFRSITGISPSEYRELN